MGAGVRFLGEVILGSTVNGCGDQAGVLECTSPVRIALIHCSAEEATAVRRSFEAEYVPAELPAGQPDFAFAVLGSSLLAGGQVPEEVARQVRCPAIAILPSADLFNTFDADMAAITLDGLDRLPFVIRRELRHDAAARRRVETALQAREAQLSVAQQLAKMGTWEWDPATDIVKGSNELIRIFGGEAPVVTMTDWLAAVVVPEDVPALREALDATAAEGALLDHRLRVIGPDGSRAFVHTRAERVTSEDGTIRVLGVSQDVTDQMTAESALRESEARYRELVTQMPGVIWSADENGRMLFVSERIASLVGFSREEILAADLAFWFQRIHRQDLVSVPELWAAMLEGNPFETEVRFRRKDDSWVWLHLRAAVEREGGAPKIIGVSTDVTARRDAEDALRASEARYRTLVEGAQDVIVSIDAEGIVQSVNRAAEELTGGSRVDWVGRSVLEALSPSSVERAEAHFKALFSGADAEPYAEYELRTKTGRYVTMETQVRPVESHGKVVGIVIVARDVTARKEAHTRAEKEKRLASLGQLATSVAHEFNNVLMSIMPFAELLRRRMPDDERVITSTGHIISAVRRGRDIAQEILRFARPVSPEIDKLIVADWIEQFSRKAESMLGPLYTVEVKLPPMDLMMSADRALLEQVATNVTLNARDAMPDGGTFSIAARDTGAAIEIELADRGPGIAPELFDRIFEPLFTTRHDGNGLGLSIAHQAMVQQGGSIHVRSVPGEGATFVLSLPRATTAEVADEPNASRSRRVLVIEDDESVGEGLRALLIDEGFEVNLVERGLQTASAIEFFHPDLVLLDVNLPDVSGIEVYDVIRSKWPELPVIFSTGHADSRALGELRDLEVPSIMKPYDFAELMTVMNTVT
jgi:PAS domain S-box-containing protein